MRKDEARPLSDVLTDVACSLCRGNENEILERLSRTKTNDEKKTTRTANHPFLNNSILRNCLQQRFKLGGVKSHHTLRHCHLYISRR